MKRTFILFLWTLLFFSCRDEQPTYEEEFNLQQLRVKHYDLHNPILNMFKMDSTARNEYPDYYVYDVYFDENDTLQYAFYKSASYGYLLEFHYNTEGKISWAKIYPISTAWVDKGAKIRFLSYFYKDGELIVVKDTMNDELIFINGMTATIYKGLIESIGREEALDISTIRKTDYYVTQMR